MPDFRLDGLRALVTGGSRGIGLGLARGLAEAGANLVLTARNPEELAAAQRELSRLGVDVQIAPFDMARKTEIAQFYDDVLTRFGPIDILINNAGMSRRGPAQDLSLDEAYSYPETISSLETSPCTGHTFS